MSSPDHLAPAGAPGNGDASALVAALYDEHAARVLAVCRALLRDPVEAEDAAQQTFLSAQRALANGSAPREPGAWLAAIARNESIGRIRGRTRQALPTAEEPAGSEPDAHAAVEQREQASHLRDALASLPAQQRDAILLREVRGLSYDEVAATLAVSTSAVESLLFRARRGLQVRLREAAAAVSTAGWVGPLRDVVSRLVEGGTAGPVAVKAVAVGLGTAVVAGGAVVVPHEIGAGHALRRAQAQPRPTAAAPAPGPRASAQPPAPAPVESRAAAFTPHPHTVAASLRLRTRSSEDDSRTSLGPVAGGSAAGETEQRSRGAVATPQEREDATRQTGDSRPAHARQTASDSVGAQEAPSSDASPEQESGSGSVLPLTADTGSVAPPPPSSGDSQEPGD